MSRRGAEGRGKKGAKEHGEQESETFQAPTRSKPVADELFVRFSGFTSGPRPAATKAPYISG
jgi:hypothetical protein